MFDFFKNVIILLLANIYLREVTHNKYDLCSSLEQKNISLIVFHFSYGFSKPLQIKLLKYAQRNFVNVVNVIYYAHILPEVKLNNFNTDS